MGRRKSDEFNRYDFIRFDPESGEYYYYDDLIFAVDSTNERETEREQLSEKLLSQFGTGILGDPSSPESVLRLWQCLDKLHHPLGRFNSEYFARIERRPGTGDAEENSTVKTHVETVE
jgi:hypothetical protein